VPTIAMALPIPPDKLDSWLTTMRELAGPRLEEYDASRRRAGVTSSKAWLQQGPGGAMELLVIEADDPARMFAELGSSQEPFDVWFRGVIANIYGLDLTQRPPGPLPEQMLDWSAEVRVTCPDGT
jgi:hypothetical protein